jgi:hypothetical protein
VLCFEPSPPVTPFQSRASPASEPEQLIEQPYVLAGLSDVVHRVRLSAVLSFTHSESKYRLGVETHLALDSAPTSNHEAGNPAVCGGEKRRLGGFRS